MTKSFFLWATLIPCLMCVMVIGSFDAYAGDFFTGFQIDNRNQYLAYGGVRAPLARPEGGFEPFVQLFAFRQNYSFRSEGQLLQAQLNQVVPAVGITKSIGQLQLGALAGAALRETQEDTVEHRRERIREIGYALQVEGSYWTDTDGFEGLVTYTSLSDFFFGRVRWKHPVFETKAKTSISPGVELLALGNSQFQEGLAGGLLELQIWKLVFLFKGGYQNNSTFHSGGYGGIEFYFPF